MVVGSIKELRFKYNYSSPVLTSAHLLPLAQQVRLNNCQIEVKIVEALYL